MAEPASPMASSVGPWRYRPRVEVLAWQVTDDNHQAVAAWCGGEVVWMPSVDGPERTVEIDTEHCQGWARQGDWVVQGVTGNFFTCHGDKFEQAYEGRVTGSSRGTYGWDEGIAP